MTNLVTNASEIIAHITMKLSDGSAADSTKVNKKPASDKDVVKSTIL